MLAKQISENTTESTGRHIGDISLFSIDTSSSHNSMTYFDLIKYPFNYYDGSNASYVIPIIDSEGNSQYVFALINKGTFEDNNDISGIYIIPSSYLSIAASNYKYKYNDSDILTKCVELYGKKSYWSIETNTQLNNFKYPARVYMINNKVYIYYSNDTETITCIIDLENIDYSKLQIVGGFVTQIGDLYFSVPNNSGEAMNFHDIQYSIDGYEFTDISLSVNYPSSSTNKTIISPVMYDNNKYYICVGLSEKSNEDYKFYLYLSSDGINWILFKQLNGFMFPVNEKYVYTNEKTSSDSITYVITEHVLPTPVFDNSEIIYNNWANDTNEANVISIYTKSDAMFNDKNNYFYIINSSFTSLLIKNS